RTDDGAVRAQRTERESMRAHTTSPLELVTHAYTLAFLDDRRDALTGERARRVAENLVETVVRICEAIVAHCEDAGERLVEQDAEVGFCRAQRFARFLMSAQLAADPGEEQHSDECHEQPALDRLRERDVL